MLVRIVKYWTYPDLARQTLKGDCNWNGVQFTFDAVEECDFLLVLNELREDIDVRCPPENVWAVFQEPFVPGYLPWMREGHQQFARVYTHHPSSSDRKYRASPPLVPWHVNKSFDELVTLSPPTKNEGISWVTSNLQTLPGHKKRFEFYRYLSSLGWTDLEVFGRGIRPVKDKWDIFERCKYSIAVENHCGFHYWTEKVADCWLTYTLPFYSGCLNLEDYFPKESFIRIDLGDFGNAARTIRRAVDSCEYEKRLPFIHEAREKLLKKNQFFPFFSHEVRQCHHSSALSQKIHLRAYRQSLFSRMRENLHRRLL